MARSIRHPAFEQDGKWMKTCADCEETKSVEEFGANAKAADGWKCYCMVCCRRQHNAWKKTPAGRASQHRRDRRYYARHRDEILTQKQQYGQREEVRVRKRAWRTSRERDNVCVRLAHRLRAGMQGMLNGRHKCARSLELLGCSIDEAKRHIEGLFRPGMSWDRWGEGDDCINLDHILPVALFDLSQPSHQRACFHYTNLQPLWKEENMAKSDRLDDGRRAGQMTPDEKRLYLTSKGYGHLFTPSGPTLDRGLPSHSQS